MVVIYAPFPRLTTCLREHIADFLGEHVCRLATESHVIAKLSIVTLVGRNEEPFQQVQFFLAGGVAKDGAGEIVSAVFPNGCC